MKKFLTLFLAVTMIAAMLPIQSLANESVILISETFEGYVTNDADFGNIKAQLGVDPRVIRENNGNKAFEAKAWGEQVKIRADIPTELQKTDSKEFVFSVKAKIDAPNVNGKFFTVSDGTNEVTFLNLKSGGQICTSNDRVLGGFIYGRWNEITVMVDIAVKKYSVYINGKCRIRDWYIPSNAIFSKVSSVAFTVSEPEEGMRNVIFDEIRVYTGKKLPSQMSFPKVAYNEEEIEYIPTADINNNEVTVLSDLDFTNNINNVSQYTTDGVQEHLELEDGNGVWHIYSTEDMSKNFYTNLGGGKLEGINRYVIEFDIRMNKMKSSSIELFDGWDAANNWRLGMRLDSAGNLTSSTTGAKTGIVPLEKWSTVSLCYNVAAGLCDVYVDKVLTYKGDKCSDSANPTTFRVDFYSGAGAELDVYFDNIRFYTGREPLPADYFQSEEEIGKVDISSRNSIMFNDEETALKLAETTEIFMFSNETYFAKGKKESFASFEHKPKMVDDLFILPQSMLSKLGYTEPDFNKETGEIKFGEKIILKVDNTSASVNGANVNLEKAPTVINGELYLPGKFVCEKVMGKIVQWDDRGFLSASKSVLPKNSDDLTEIWEDIDAIYGMMQFEHPKGEKIIADIKARYPYNQHPRILLTKSDVDYILAKVETDDKYKKAFATMIETADKALQTTISPNLPDADKQLQSQVFEGTMNYLGMAYLLTGEEKYAKAGLEMLLNACSWDHLASNLSYLTTGHWANGVAKGYDSFYNYIIKQPNAKEILNKITTAAYDKALSVYEASYAGVAPARWTQIRDNFLGVVGGGMLNLALVMTDVEQLHDTEVYLLENILKSIEGFTSFFYPNGGYFEGHSYLRYGMITLNESLEALFNSCGTDYGVGLNKGFSEFGYFDVYGQTPIGRFNFHDAPTGVTDHISSVWVAYRYNQPFMMEAVMAQRNMMNMNSSLKMLMYYDKTITDKGINVDTSTMALDRYFPVTEVGYFVDGFDSKTPVYAAIHGGRTGMTHDSLDLGEFVFQSDGVWWAEDLGADDYNLPGYFSVGVYEVYRKRPEGENCVVLNPSVDPLKYPGQNINAKVELIDFESKPKGGKAAYDLTDGYKRDVEKYVRGYYFGDNRNTFTVQDEITFKNNVGTDAYWFMHTAADIQIVDNKTAILTQNGKKLKAEVYCNAPTYELMVMDAKPFPQSPTVEGQNQNIGYRKLTVKANGAKDLVISVKLIPDNLLYNPTPLQYKPIKEWIIPDGDITKPERLTGIYVDGVPLDGFHPNVFEYRITLPFGTEKAPNITATSNVGTISVKQAGNVFDSSIVTLNDGERDIPYTITYEVSGDREIFVTDDIRNTKPVLGIMGTSIIPKASTMSSIPEPMNGPANLIDDNLSTVSAISGIPVWFEIDLGEVQQIRGVSVAFKEGSKRIQYYDIFYSEDGINYKRVFSGESLGTTEDFESVAVSGKARYIRLVGNGNSTSSWNTLKELRAYK